MCVIFPDLKLGYIPMIKTAYSYMLNRISQIDQFILKYFTIEATHEVEWNRYKFDCWYLNGNQMHEKLFKSFTLMKS